MDKDETFTMRIDADLKRAFNETANRLDTPAAALIREYMRHIVKTHAQQDLPIGGSNGRKNR